MNIYFTEIFRYWVEVYKYFVLVSIYTYAVTFWTISNQTSLLKWWKRFRAIWRYVNQTNWSSVTQTQTHIYQLGLGNGLEHVRHQAINGNNVDLRRLDCKRLSNSYQNTRILCHEKVRKYRLQKIPHFLQGSAILSVIGSSSCFRNVSVILYNPSGP